jgi:hypothetical protein
MKTNVTYLDMARVGSGIAYPLIEENVQHAPELTVVPASPMIGDSMTLAVRTDLPTVAFRRYNEGTARSKSKFATRVFQAMPLAHQIAVDKEMADNQVDRGRFLQSHASGVMEAKLRLISHQFYYGTGEKADKGFPGLIAQVPDDARHTVDATGAAVKTSVWLLGLGPEKVEFLLPGGRTANLQGDWPVETVYDDDGNPFQAYTNWLNGSIGMRVANRNCAIRIKNIGIADGKTLNDSLLYKAMELADELKFTPTHIFMRGRSLEQLRSSRTPHNDKGDPVPLPTTWEGIPIIRTQGISLDE